MLHKPNELIKDANMALDLLKAGNKRYLDAKLSEKGDYKTDRDILVESQKPFAVIVCCSDSRVAPEIFFDQKLGDIFVIRNAGNVVDQTALGSIEYAVEHLGSKLVVVCGHSHCGAVTAAVAGGHLPKNIKSITDRIAPAKAMGGEVDEVIRNNAKYMAEQVKADEIIIEFGTTVVSAYYNIHTGEVNWL